MKTSNQRILGRREDLQLTWVTREFGLQWEAWRAYAAEWMATQHVGLGKRQTALRYFFAEYLHKLGLPPEPHKLLLRTNHCPDFYETACPKSEYGIGYGNVIRQFLSWVLEHHFSEPDDHGRPIELPAYHNPVPRRSSRGLSKPHESVHSPLPYRFIRELSDILAPGEHFRDWHWAHDISGKADRKQGPNGDWFRVREQDIVLDDPDCVWRRRQVGKREVFELWYPGRAVALFTKLTLPLRTHQVRMLDSGEADTWCYASSGWVINKGSLASGDARKPVRRGVFRRIEDRESGSTFTGFYINTNKTADTKKDADYLGYVIPWQHEKLLYWLEKLRNWQEKYNPARKVTAWTELGIKHLEHPRSEMQLALRPPTCFLFRNALALGDDRRKPLTSHQIEGLWHKLLVELEQRCASRGETMADGRPLQFARAGKKGATMFPLHSLRVSLLTSLALDAEVPLVVLSKLVAGHSRLVMTLYYTKVGIARMTQMMNDASEKLNTTATESLQRFLADATYDQLPDGSVFNNLDSLRAALPERMSDRNPAGWMPRHYGLCLMGGNTSPGEAMERIGGCFNGGPPVEKNRRDPNPSLYDAVPGGVGNCVRCRWFVTEPRYLDSLRAHFNNVSYHLAEAAKEARDREETLEKLKELRYAAEQAGKVFAKQAEYVKMERLWESSLAKADQLANDLTATYRLIRRCMALIERDREEAKGGQQLVAVGALRDLHIAFEDTQSELLQLAGVCLDAEVYPDESPGKAIVRRSQFLDSALYREGLQPVFLTLSEDEQLRLGNRFINHLAAMSKPDDPVLGLRRVVDTLEAGRSLQEIGAVDDMLEMLETALHAPLMRVSDIAYEPSRRRQITENVQ